MQRVWSTYYNDNVGSHSRNTSAANHTQRQMDDRNFSYPYRGRPESEESNISAQPILDSATPMAYEQRLNPPLPPFSNNSNNSPTLSHVPSIPSIRAPGSITGGDNISLTVNYLPSKFSRPHSPGIHYRKNRGVDVDNVPKRGGGRDAFKAGEARMPGPGDEDYDGVVPRYGKKPKLRWNRFKWVLFCANSLLTIYSLLGLIFCLLTWFNVWQNADIIRVANRPELILSTLAACVAIFTSLIGWSGLLLNNRAFLAVYNLLMWITFALLVVPGYITYRRQAFDLEGKINFEWSRTLGTIGRLRIQNELICCGYFSPFTEATISQTCYARSILPGCKQPFLKFEEKALQRWFIVVFSLVPLQLGIMVAGLLCSNHVTYRFGKGMMPKAYRLSLNSMAVIMDQYANQLAEQYGTEIASTALAKTRLNLSGSGSAAGMPSSSHVGVALDMHPLPTVPYASQTDYRETNRETNVTPPAAYTSAHQHSTPGGYQRPGAGVGDGPWTPSGGSPEQTPERERERERAYGAGSGYTTIGEYPPQGSGDGYYARRI